ncbi:MAG: hypothetical protein JSV36_19710 [Anaerolineae bacterium]|nr:MAG: hypothetical protein JSV36_19710 [Anaerolineae bacterium]
MSVSVSQPIEALERLYRTGFQSSFLDSALRKVVARQIERDQADLAHIEQVLTDFEGQYGLDSDEFWRRYQAGQTDDSADFVEWNVACKMRQRLLSRLEILKGDSGGDGK